MSTVIVKRCIVDGLQDIERLKEAGFVIDSYKELDKGYEVYYYVNPTLGVIDCLGGEEEC